MPEYLAPGVFVEELDTGPKPIEGVGTSTAAFIGFTEKVPQETKRVNGRVVTVDQLNTPFLITNWTQYVEQFGNFVSGAYLPLAVYGYFQNGGSRCYVISVQTMPKAKAALLNQQGKPKLIVESKQAGIDGSLMRVRIEPRYGDNVTVLPTEDGSSDAKPGLGDASVTPESFTVYVEEETLTGGWASKEAPIRDVKLVEDVESKKVRVQYATRQSQWVNLEIPETDAPLATLAASARNSFTNRSS